MRIALGLLASSAIFLAVGYALLYALGLARRVNLPLIGLSYLAGWALLASVLSLALIAGAPMGVATTTIAAAALAAVCVLAGRRRSAAPPTATVGGGRHPLARLAVVLGAVVIAIEAAAALVVSVQNLWTPDIDLMTAWMPRAASIHFAHRLDARVWESFVCPWYPPLTPTMYASTFDFVGGFHPSLLAPQQTVLGIAFLLAVLWILDRFAPRWLSLPALALLLSAPWFWWRLHSLLPDQTLAYLLVAGALACVAWLHERRGAWLGLAVVFLTAATLTKVEGALFAGLLVAVVIAAGLVLYRRAGLPAAVLLIAPASMIPWYAWLRQHRVPTSTPDYNAPNAISPGFLVDHFGRLTYALHYMLAAPFGSFVAQLPTILAICLSIAAFLLVARRLPVISAAVAAWLVLSFLLLAVIYWISRVDVYFYVSTSAPRVGTTLIIAAITLMPLLIGLALTRDQVVARDPSGSRGVAAASRAANPARTAKEPRSPIA